VKRVKCKSGLSGRQQKLQRMYRGKREFISYTEIYNIHGRLGFKSAERCWTANPLVEYSIDPSDFRRVREVKTICHSTLV